MTTSALKRRSFLQGSLLAAAVIGSTPAVAAEAAKPKFDESFDVIVVPVFSNDLVVNLI